MNVDINDLIFNENKMPKGRMEYVIVPKKQREYLVPPCTTEITINGEKYIRTTGSNLIRRVSND